MVNRHDGHCMVGRKCSDQITSEDRARAVAPPHRLSYRLRFILLPGLAQCATGVWLSSKTDCNSLLAAGIPSAALDDLEADSKTRDRPRKRRQLPSLVAGGTRHLLGLGRGRFWRIFFFSPLASFGFGATTMSSSCIGKVLLTPNTTTSEVAVTHCYLASCHW